MKTFDCLNIALAAILIFWGGGFLTSCETIYEAEPGEVPPRYDEKPDDDPDSELPAAGYEELSFSLSAPVTGIPTGGSATFSVSIAGLSADKSLPEVTYQWSSSDDEVLKVIPDKSTAIVEGLKSGKAVLTVSCAEYENLSASVGISVIDLQNPYPFLSLSLSSSVPDEFITGSESAVSATVLNYPAGSQSPVTLTWTSSDPSVMSVSPTETVYDGGSMSVTVSAVKPGTAVLTVSCNEYEDLRATLEIKVENPGEYNKIYIDFGDDYQSAAPWNNCSAFQEYSLKDEQGLDSGVSLDLTPWKSVTDIFDSYYKTMFATEGPITFNGIEFPLEVSKDQLYIYNKDVPASFTVSGLDPEKTYEFTTMSIRFNGASNVREMTISVQGRGEAMSCVIKQGLKCITQAAAGEEPYCVADDWDSIDWGRFCKVFSVVPAEDGTVTVSMSGTKIGSVQQAHLNALVIAPVKPDGQD